MKKIKWINYLKAFAAILVVVGHAISFQFTNSDIPIGIEIIENVIYAVHVPLFFVIAGYLCKCPKNFGGGIIGKRLNGF